MPAIDQNAARFFTTLGCATHVRLTPWKTIQLSIEESLMGEVQQREIIAKERQHAQAYLDQPQQLEEIEEWQPEQVWERNEPGLNESMLLSKNVNVMQPRSALLGNNEEKLGPATTTGKAG
jgi:hypothetical protein